MSRMMKFTLHLGRQYRQHRHLIEEAFGPSPGDARSLEPCAFDNQVRGLVPPPLRPRPRLRSA